jgi:ATP-dependent Zn protease
VRKAAYITGGILLLLVLIVFFFRPSDSSEPDKLTREFSDFLHEMRLGLVTRIEITGNRLDVRLEDGREYETRKEEGASLFSILADNDIDYGSVEIAVKEDRVLDNWLGLLLNFLPALIFLGILIALIRAINRLNRIAK